MDDRIDYIEKSELRGIISKVNVGNNYDFSTFIKNYENYVNSESKWVAKEICDFLYDELGFSCDADLVDITNDELDEILYFIDSLQS